MLDSTIAPLMPWLAQVEGGLTMTAITQYLFWVSTVAMGAGALFFFLERTSVPVAYRSVLTVAGLVCGIACFHYFRMGATYAAGDFPTEYRYIDWIITTPLLLVKFPLLLRLGKAGRGLLVQLVSLDVVMIVTAYIAEVSPVGGGLWWGFFLIACVAELASVGLLYGKMSGVIRSAPERPSNRVRYSGPSRMRPCRMDPGSSMRQSLSGSPMTVPTPSRVPSAVLQATSARPSPSRSYTMNWV